MSLSQDRQHLLEVARGELHVREDAGPNRDSAGRIQQYWDSVIDPDSESWIGYKPGTDRANEWCAAWASWLYKQAGYPLEHRRGVGYYGCGMIINWLAARDAWWDWREWQTVEPGDLILFDWQRLASQLKDDVEITASRAAQVVDHVGIVERVDTDAGIIHTIEGNWNGGVNRALRPIDRGNILGFGCVLPS